MSQTEHLKKRYPAKRWPPLHAGARLAAVKDWRRRRGYLPAKVEKPRKVKTMMNHDAIRKLVNVDHVPMKEIAKACLVTYQRIQSIVTAPTKPQKPRSKCLIYFVRVADFVKIGETNDLQTRLDNIALNCPLPLELLGVLVGSHATEEVQLHEQFASLRHWAEWFRAEPELLQWIQAHADPPPPWTMRPILCK